MFVQLLGIVLVAIIPIFLLYVTVSLLGKGLLHPEYFKETSTRQTAENTEIIMKKVIENSSDNHSFGRYKRFS